MYTQANAVLEPEVVLNPSHFKRGPGAGLTRDNLSEFAVHQEGREFCVRLIIGFLSNITHYLSSAQCALDSWQPRQVRNAADTIWSECITVGAERAAYLARTLQDHVEASRPRQARRVYAQLRDELIFVWEDLQIRLEALRLDIEKNNPT